jgi:hypothetical protein
VPKGAGVAALPNHRQHNRASNCLNGYGRRPPVSHACQPSHGRARVPPPLPRAKARYDRLPCRSLNAGSRPMPLRVVSWTEPRPCMERWLIGARQQPLFLGSRQSQAQHRKPWLAPPMACRAAIATPCSFPRGPGNPAGKWVQGRCRARDRLPARRAAIPFHQFWRRERGGSEVTDER